MTGHFTSYKTRTDHELAHTKPNGDLADALAAMAVWRRWRPGNARPAQELRPDRVLHGIDLALADGEMLVIVGASGCGKSTLLRLVAGLERPTSGRVVVDGRDVTNLHSSERDIAMVFQNYALYLT